MKGGDGIILLGQKPAVISPPFANASGAAAANAHSPVMQKASEAAGVSAANSSAPAPVTTK